MEPRPELSFDENLARCLRLLKTGVTVDQLKKTMEDLNTLYDEETFKELTAAQLQQFQDVFDFKRLDMIGWKKELAIWVHNHSEFYNLDPAKIYDKMSWTLEEYNQAHNSYYKRINWIPEFGGMLQQSGNRQKEWLRDSQTPLFDGSFIPEKTEKAKRPHRVARLRVPELASDDE